MASRLFPKGETIRLAMHEIPRFVLIDPKTEKFDGIFTPLANLIDDFFSGPGINRTLHPTTYGFGTFNHKSGKYSGILGMLQSNQSDITFDPNVDFGLVEGNGVIRGQLMECEPPAVISGYNSITPTYPVDILVDTLADIGILNLSLFLLTLILCTMLLCARGYHTPIMSVVTYMLQKIPIQIRNYTTVSVCITLTITLFNLSLIFISLLHINLVKVEMPIIVNGYQDIIDRLERMLSDPSTPEFKVTWLAEYPDTELFRQGALGSKEARLWEASVKLRGPHFIYLRRDFIIFGEHVRNQSMVMILNQGYAHFVRNIICDINDANVNFHVWISVDKDANRNQKGYLIRKSLSGPLRTWTDERQMRILEAGMLTYFYKVSKEMRISQIDKTTRSNCSSDAVMVHNPHDGGDATLGNGPLKESYYTCAVIIVLSMIALFGEKVFSPKKPFRGRRRRRPHRRVRYEDIIKIDI